jgi:excisionase family DNA binding protein
VTSTRLAYRAAEAAAVTGLGERTIWRAIATGSLPAIRHGRATLILASTLEAWLRGQEEAALPAASGVNGNGRAH